MLCKIERSFARWGANAFRVSGELRGDCVKILEELLLNVRHRVALDLKEVTLTDRHAVALLALCERNGGQLLNCPAYLRELVTYEQANVQSERK